VVLAVLGAVRIVLLLDPRRSTARRPARGPFPRLLLPANRRSIVSFGSSGRGQRKAGQEKEQAAHGQKLGNASNQSGDDRAAQARLCGEFPAAHGASLHLSGISELLRLRFSPDFWRFSP
jgi:hypothetical protein